MRYLLVFLCLFSTFSAMAKPAGAGVLAGAGNAYCFQPLPGQLPYGPGCAPDWGGHSDHGTIHTTGSNPAITTPQGTAMAYTHANVLIWDVHDVAFSHAESTMCLFVPGGSCTEYVRVANGGSSNDVSIHYYLANPFGNGTTVHNRAYWTLGSYIAPWVPFVGGFIHQYFYLDNTSIGPITQ